MCYKGRSCGQGEEREWELRVNSVIWRSGRFLEKILCCLLFFLEEKDLITVVENSRKKYQMYKKVFDVTVHLLNSWWKKIWELKNEDEEVACV